MSGRRALTSIALAVAAVGLCAGPSYAGNVGSGPVTEPGKGGVRIILTSTTDTQHKDGDGNTGETATIPPCWYEKVGDWEAYRDLMDRLNQGSHDNGTAESWSGWQAWYDKYMALLAQHEDDTPPGTFYQADCADWSSDAGAAWAANNPDYVYVKANTKPDIPIVDPKVLALYAVKSAILPNPAPQLSPSATAPSIVNLTTWAWQTGITMKDLKATLGAQAATAVMTPTLMTLTTDGPTVSGIPTVCQSSNGDIGLAYKPGESDPSAPGCGLKFTVPTAPGSHYTIHADVTWHITWTSPQVAGVQTLPDVHMVTDTPVTVAEIQSIN